MLILACEVSLVDLGFSWVFVARDFESLEGCTNLY